MDRMATCPGCSKPMRLTEDELIRKRETCLICDATFDISPGDLRGESPSMVAGVAMSLGHPWIGAMVTLALVGLGCELTGRDVGDWLGARIWNPRKALP